MPVPTASPSPYLARFHDSLSALKEQLRSLTELASKSQTDDTGYDKMPDSPSSNNFASRSGAMGFFTPRSQSLDGHGKPGRGSFSDSDTIYHDADDIDGNYEYDMDSIRQGRSPDPSGAVDDDSSLSGIDESDYDQELQTPTHDSTAATSVSTSSSDSADSHKTAMDGSEAAVQRRSRLPVGVSGEEVSIFGLLKRNMGKVSLFCLMSHGY